jgi:hypothetical protein
MTHHGNGIEQERHRALQEEKPSRRAEIRCLHTDQKLTTEEKIHSGTKIRQMETLCGVQHSKRDRGRARWPESGNQCRSIAC